MKVGDLALGDYVRTSKGRNKIYKIKEIRSFSSIVVWRIDPITKVEQSNDFIIMNGSDEVDKVTL